MIDVGSGQNADIVENNPTLYGYSCFIREIRVRKDKGLSLENAVEEAARYCIDHGILADFLIRNQSEVMNMVLEEYNEAEVMEMLRREYKEDGYKEGREEGREEGRRETRKEIICRALKAGYDAKAVAAFLQISLEEVEAVAKQ